MAGGDPPETSNIQRPTFNIQRDADADALVGSWTFDVGRSMLDVRCWKFDVGSSTLEVRRWTFDVGSYRAVPSRNPTASVPTGNVQLSTLNFELPTSRRCIGWKLDGQRWKLSASPSRILTAWVPRWKRPTPHVQHPPKCRMHADVPERSSCPVI